MGVYERMPKIEKKTSYIDTHSDARMPKQKFRRQFMGKHIITLRGESV